MQHHVPHRQQPFPDQAPNDKSAAGARLAPALSWGAIYCLAVPVFSRGLCLLGRLPWVLGDDTLESPSGEADGPEEPSESDLSDVQPPTPIAELPGLEPYAPGGIESFVRPSDSDLARSSAPSIGEPFPDNPAFDMDTVPVLQRRAACLQEVDNEPAPRPFLPAGCPVVVHNPFAIAAQITLHTSVVGTPQILREVLNDFAYRRGWQPIVCVQPQPNSDAIHLMPAAADEGLAAVLLRSGEALYPRCMTRRMPAADYHSITIQGRRGRLRVPYTTRHQPGTPFDLRDGDCIHADLGPWGPPPPTPAVLPTPPPSQGSCVRARLARVVLFGLLMRFGAFPFVSLPLIFGCAMVVPASEAEYYDGAIHVGLFPWRNTEGTGQVSAISAGHPFRCVIHCPWTGTQGSFVATSDTTVIQLERNFARATLAGVGIVPVWPSPQHARLAVVPRLQSSALACVLLHYSGAVRAAVLPRPITYDDLLSSLRFCLDGDVNQVRLPPALHARRILTPSQPIHLRDGDLLDVLAERPRDAGHRVRTESFLRHSLLWTRDFEIRADITVRLWMPHVHQPILTWLTPGMRWDACDLTFSGGFRDRYPGLWVPVVWSAGAGLHLVQASSHPGRVAVLHDSAAGVAGLSIVPSITTAEMAELLHTLPSQVTVPSTVMSSPDDPCRLRDGDVLWDALGYDAERAEWPYILDQGIGDVIPLAVSGLLAAHSRLGLLAMILLAADRAVAMHQPPPGRGRSRSRSRSVDATGRSASPRAGYWQASRSRPLANVFTGSHCEYRICCPFRGLSPSGVMLPHSTKDLLLAHVQCFSGPWATDFLFTGPLARGDYVLLLPVGSGPLVTLLISAGALTRAVVFPSHTRFHDLQLFCQRSFQLPGLALRCHPALRSHVSWPYAPLHLRHGDSFALHIPDTFHSFRAMPIPSVFDLCSIPHYNMWHLDFSLRKGGWAHVWKDGGHPDLHCTRVWIEDGAI